MYLLAKYNTQTDITFPMVKRGVVDLAVTGDWTPATGDCKVSKDGGAVANSTNNPAIASGVSWKLTLTATELSCKDLTVQIVDSATKAVEDQFLKVLTYGNASAYFPAPDYQDAVHFGLTALPNAAAGANGGLPLGDASARVDVSKIAGAAVSTASAQLGVNVVNVGGTAQTARDLGANIDTTVSSRLASSALVVDSGTAQAGGASTITLRSGAVATDNFYSEDVVVITSGTGAGQSNRILSYVGATRVANIDATWATNPDNTSVYVVIGFGKVRVSGIDDGTILASKFGTDSITATALAASAVSEITVAVVDQALSGHTTAGTVGGALNSASSAGDPWNTALPGAYAGGTAGNIVGNRVDAAISSRMATFTLPTNFSSLAIDVSGRVTVGAIVNGAIAAATFAANALDAVWSTVTRTITGGTITTNSDKTGYSLANGSIAAATFAAGAIDANAIATDAIGSAELAASAVTEIAAGVSLGSAPTAAQNAAAVWDLAISGHTTSGTFGAKLNAAGGAGGSGSTLFTYTVYKTDGTTPLGSCAVWVTTDAAGVNVIAGTLYSNDVTGQVQFLLDPGTVYIWRQHPAYIFTNPDTEVVS